MKETFLATFSQIPEFSLHHVVYQSLSKKINIYLLKFNLKLNLKLKVIKYLFIYFINEY